MLKGAVLIFAIATAWHFQLRSDFFSYPRKVRPDTGQTIPYEVKGITVYISPDQNDTVDRLFWVEVVSGGIALVLMFVRQYGPEHTKRS